MKNLLFALFFLTFLTPIFGKEPNIPEKYNFKTEQDFKKYEADVLDCINWLLDSPFRRRMDLREKAQLFVLAWMTETPTLVVTVRPEFTKALENNPLLLITYLNSCTKYNIESGKKEFTFETHYNGILTTLDFYLKNKKSLNKNKMFESYYTLRKKDLLEKTLRKEF